jgi:hypothetical protein
MKKNQTTPVETSERMITRALIQRLVNMDGMTSVREDFYAPFTQQILDEMKDIVVGASNAAVNRNGLMVTDQDIKLAIEQKHGKLIGFPEYQKNIRKPYTDEQRKAAADRLAGARKRKNSPVIQETSNEEESEEEKEDQQDDKVIENGHDHYREEEEEEEQTKEEEEEQTKEEEDL